MTDSGVLANRRVDRRPARRALLRLAAFAVALGCVVAAASWFVLRQADNAWCAIEIYRRGVIVDGEGGRDWRTSDELDQRHRSQVRCEPGREPYLVE